MTDLNTQIGEKKLLVEMKQKRVDDVKSQTAHYRRQLSNRQDELNKSRKSHDRSKYPPMSPFASARHSHAGMSQALSSIWASVPVRLSLARLWGSSTHSTSG